MQSALQGSGVNCRPRFWDAATGYRLPGRRRPAGLSALRWLPWRPLSPVCSPQVARSDICAAAPVQVGRYPGESRSLRTSELSKVYRGISASQRPPHIRRGGHPRAVGRGLAVTPSETFRPANLASTAARAFANPTPRGAPRQYRDLLAKLGRVPPLSAAADRCAAERRPAPWPGNRSSLCSLSNCMPTNPSTELNILVSSSARAGVAMENPATDRRAATAVAKPNLCRNTLLKNIKSSHFFILETLRKSAMSKISTRRPPLSFYPRSGLFRGGWRAIKRHSPGARSIVRDLFAGAKELQIRSATPATIAASARLKTYHENDPT